MPGGTRTPFLAIAATGRDEGWRYVVGGIAVAIAYLGASMIAAVGLLALAGGVDAALAGAGSRVAPAALLALVMAPSLILLLATLAVVVILHGRGPVTLVTASSSIRWRRVAEGGALWGLLTAAFELVAYALDPQNYHLSFEPGRFLPVLVVALLMVPLQSAAEEVFFRGYLLQGLGSRFGGRPWVALLLTSVGFGALHGANPEMSEFGRIFLLYYVGMGVLMGLVALVDDGLEVAIGAHAINNLYGSLLVSFPSSVLDMPSIFRMTRFPALLMSLFGVGIAVLFWWLLSRRYGWSSVFAVLAGARRGDVAQGSGQTPGSPPAA